MFDWRQTGGEMQHAVKHVTFGRMVSYSLPWVSVGMLFNPLFLLQGIYIKYYGFSLAAMAGILLAARMFDAVTDPIVGVVSDVWKKKTGRRKPFVVVGALMFLIGGTFVYMPMIEPTVFYLTFWLLLLYLGYTIFSIPHTAWGSELVTETHERTRIYTFVMAFTFLGLVLFYSIPLLPIFETSEFTPEVLKVCAIIAAIIMIPSLILCYKFAPEGEERADQNKGAANSWKSLVRIAANPIFRIFIAAYVSAAIGLGIWYGMIFLYVDIYLKAGALIAPLYLISYIISVVAVFVFERIVKTVGAKLAWSGLQALAAIAVIATSMIRPDGNVTVALGFVFTATSIVFICSGVLVRSMLGRIVDETVLKHQVNQGGSYFATYIFLEKASFAIAISLGLWMAGILGFDPTAAEQSARGIFALEVVMSWMPAVFLIISIALWSFIPMSEKRHAAIRKELDGQAQKVRLAS